VDKWENKYIELPKESLEKMMEAINEEGEKGWEFCTALWVMYRINCPNPLSPFASGDILVGIFKRKKQEIPSSPPAKTFRQEADEVSPIGSARTLGSCESDPPEKPSKPKQYSLDDLVLDFGGKSAPEPLVAEPENLDLVLEEDPTLEEPQSTEPPAEEMVSEPPARLIEISREENFREGNR